MARPRVLIVQNHPLESLGRYETYLGEHDISLSVCHAYKNSTLPSLRDFDALVVGGTPTSVYDPNKPNFFRREAAYLAEAIRLSKPCLGVCGGGQMLASILGAKVRRNQVKEIGIYMAKLTRAGRASKFFDGFPTKFRVLQWHGDTFGIPSRTRLLAKAEDCRNQAFSYGNSLALQFHLEVTSKMLAEWADEYEAELGNFGRTKTEVLKDCREAEEGIGRLSDRLMRNFLAGLIAPLDQD